MSTVVSAIVRSFADLRLPSRRGGPYTECGLTRQAYLPSTAPTRGAPKPLDPVPSFGMGGHDRPPSLDHLIRPRQQRQRDGEAKGLAGLEVDHQLEHGGFLDGQVGGRHALQDFVDIRRRASAPGRESTSVGGLEGALGVPTM